MTLAQVAVDVPLRGVVVEVPVAKGPGPRAAGRGLLDRTSTRRIRLCACTRTSHGAEMTPAALRTVRRSMRPPFSGGAFEHRRPPHARPSFPQTARIQPVNATVWLNRSAVVWKPSV